jgi:hypothetical protein
MNKRIFELAKQADLIQWDTLSSGARTPDHESVVKARKFAELIVRECIGKCEFVADMATVTNSGEMARKTKATADSCAAMIKEHFGVEE